jgi:hypothetical protein
MKMRKLLLAACFVTIVTSALAQHTCPPRETDPLKKIWEANEGDWNAKWDPVSAPVTRPDGARVANYRGAWSKPTGFGHYSSSEEKVQGTLTIAINGNAVEIDRVETPNMRNTCHYRGTLTGPNSDIVHGFYTCSYHPIRQEWRARVLTFSSMFCDANEPRLSLPWHEQEGEWRGEWVPTATPGRYTANFRKGGETSQATMTIQITENNYHDRILVKARRTQARGTCEYDGTLTPNADGFNVTGRYQCSWGGGNLPWSAVIGAGHL